MSVTLTRPELTVEEIARRARMTELRTLIAKESGDRRLIKSAWRMNHSSDQFKAELARLRPMLGITKYYDWQGNVPYRNYGRSYVTELHIELAKLRGKVHLTPKKAPVAQA